MKIKTVAIGQGGGPTPVINDEVAGALYVAKKHNLRVLGIRNGLEGLMNADTSGNIIDISGWEPDYVSEIPGAVLHTTRMKVEKGKDDAAIETILRNMDRFGINSIAYFGGNDSSLILQALGIGVHGSKTIDNDLMEAHHTPGYGSAALFNAIALRNLALDIGSFSSRGTTNSAESYLTAPVLVYQTMGRDTGWLALAAGFAKVRQDGSLDPEAPPDIIWPRELPFDKDVYLGELSNILQRRGRAFVVIGEELVNSDGVIIEKLYGETLEDAHGHTQHARSGTFNYADWLAKISKELKVGGVASIKETPISPQHIQRSYMKSTTDAAESFDVGMETMNAILDGDNQISVVLKQNPEFNPFYRMRAERVPVQLLAGKTRSVPLEFINGVKGPTEEFIKQFLPVIGYEDALPHHHALDFSRIVHPRKE